ncbi:MAG: HAD family phosphatase [Alistipes sp.]|nr:HAD family phosphatase [Alistipes sp.]
MKNIIFDLGGVVFARDRSKCSPEFIEFWSLLRENPMPHFWIEYDRGTLSIEQVVDELVAYRNATPDVCRQMLRKAIDLQEARIPTAALIADLKAAGYKLYVLSNMSLEFIQFLRRLPVYSHFDGEVVSCEELTVKPEPRIYEILLSRYGLDPCESMFIDDRPENTEAAAAFGIKPFVFDAKSPESSCQELRSLLL